MLLEAAQLLETEYWFRNVGNQVKTDAACNHRRTAIPDPHRCENLKKKSPMFSLGRRHLIWFKLYGFHIL